MSKRSDILKRNAAECYREKHDLSILERSNPPNASIQCQLNPSKNLTVVSVAENICSPNDLKRVIQHVIKSHGKGTLILDIRSMYITPRVVYENLSEITNFCLDDLEQFDAVFLRLPSGAEMHKGKYIPFASALIPLGT